MMEDQYMSLITDYIDGSLTAVRKAEFDRYVAEGHIDMTEVQALLELDAKVQQADQPEPTPQLKETFYQALGEEVALQKQQVNQAGIKNLWAALFGSIKGRLAFGFAVLIIGVAVGRLYSGMSYERKMDNLSNQMADMKEMMMMAMLENKSVSDRLKGVQMSSQLVKSNSQVTEALFVTLNHDESTNVRLAALNMLAEYASDPNIRAGLINSISQQQSPIMQVALAELMVDLQEEKAIQEFKPVLEGDNTPEEVKTTLRENLDKIM